MKESKFINLSALEQRNIFLQVGACLKANKLSTVDVQIYREEVCLLNGQTVESDTVLWIAQEVPSEFHKFVEKFKVEVAKIIKGMDSVKINLNSVIGFGDTYRTINYVSQIQDPNTPIQLQHKD